MSEKERPYSVNGYIAIAPFQKDLQVKINEKARLAGITQKSELARSVVVYGTKTIPEGSLVFMRGESHKATEATIVMEVEPEKPFVLMMESLIQLVFPPGMYPIAS